MLGRNMICVECINCLCINIANGIRLLDKMAIFVYTGKNFIQVRAFESNIYLNNPKIAECTIKGKYEWDSKRACVVITYFLA